MKFIAYVLALAIFYFVIFILVHSYLSIPIVYWSVSENKCKMIETNGIKDDKCNLPKKYELVYIK